MLTVFVYTGKFLFIPTWGILSLLFYKPQTGNKRWHAILVGHVMRNLNFKKFHPKFKRTKAITTKEEVESNPDMHIDQDFAGYPHGHSKDEIIKPETKTAKKIAGISSTKSK